MAAFSIKSFGGISPKVPPRYLQDSQAQIALNCPVFNGPVQPLPDVSAAVITLPNERNPRTIYRFGQDVDEDARYWFDWGIDVDVCRSQIAGDEVEWTFYTGDGPPKATYNTIALTGTDYPAAAIPLGLPRPRTALQAVVPPFTPATYPAELRLDITALANLTDLGAEISTDGGATYTDISLAALPDGARAAYVAAQINAAGAAVTAAVELNDVVISSTATGPTANIFFRGITGSETNIDTSGTFTYGSLNISDTGGTALLAMYEITASQITTLRVGDRVRLQANSQTSNSFTTCVDATLTTTYSGGTAAANATAFAALLNSSVVVSGALTITAMGSSVLVFGVAATGGYGVSTPDRDGKIRFVVNDLNAPDKVKATAPAGRADYARIFVTKTQFDSNLKGRFAAITINNEAEVKQQISSTASLQALMGFSGTYGTMIGDDGSVIMVETTLAGPSAVITLKDGMYGTTTENAYFTIYATGSEDTQSVPESRVYTYTWVNEIAGFQFESGPADPSLSVDVYTDQSVTLSNFDTPLEGYTYTARRIYRSVSGTYLFVAEIPATQSSYVDSVKAEDLAEEMIVTGWKEPPANLTGLINLPNGIMAGFVGRDVYFCDPYHPHAWPEGYVQTVDYPVVGLGRMDTTLVVLTKGTPYFIQGTHPDSMVVSKSDIQQSCSSKRSIVSINGVVIYASPDGLVMLASGGSRVLTENMFTRAQWQEIKPESIHAYQHDMKYIAFYDTGTAQGGFIYDLTSQQMIFHDIYATTGFSDLLRDQLFVSFTDGTIRKWLGGANKNYVWRSKVFTMPQVMGFSCAQVEAESYPVTAKFYADGTLYHTQTVTSRNMFRLPAKVGRDHEVQLETNATVFSIAVAQSSEELANA